MKIVIIDDDMALLKTLEMLFGTQHDVIAFYDPYEAYEFFRGSPPVDAIIVDYMMPSMTGDKLLNRIRDHVPGGCKIILISGYTDKIRSLDLEQMGVTTFLPKPLDLDNLFKAVGAEEAING